MRLKRKDYKQFELVDKTHDELKLDEETKDSKLTALPKWLSSKNDFNKAAELINNIWDDTNNAKPGSGNKRFWWFGKIDKWYKKSQS